MPPAGTSEVVNLAFVILLFPCFFFFFSSMEFWGFMATCVRAMRSSVFFLFLDEVFHVYTLPTWYLST